MIRERAFVFVLSVLSWLVFSSAARDPLDTKPNFHIYEVEPHSRVQWSQLRSFSKDNESYALMNDLESNSKIVLLVAPEKVPEFEEKLNNIGMKFEFLERNSVADLSIEPGSEYNWKQYHTLNDTFEWLKSLTELYPEQASLFVAGKSHEGRDLLGIKISHGDDKKAIFIEGGIHAREWISPATTTFIIHQLLTSERDDVRLLAKNFDWYIVPHVNPDGYVYTYTTDRLWRKSRSPQANGCYGVDLNRNWDFHWGEQDSSTDPCSTTYAGSEPFSEMETRTLSNYITNLKDKLFLYVAVHSYLQVLLYPYGYTSELVPNIANYKRIYDAAIVGLGKRYGNKYSGGSFYEGMYPASGVSTDWVYAVAGVNYTFVYELSPSNSQFFKFRLPAKRILQTAEETLDSLVEMVKEAVVERNDIADGA